MFLLLKQLRPSPDIILSLNLKVICKARQSPSRQVSGSSTCSSGLLSLAKDSAEICSLIACKHADHKIFRQLKYLQTPTPKDSIQKWVADTLQSIPPPLKGEQPRISNSGCRIHNDLHFKMKESINILKETQLYSPEPLCSFQRSFCKIYLCQEGFRFGGKEPGEDILCQQAR